MAEPGIAGWTAPDAILLLALLLVAGLALVYWSRFPRGVRDVPPMVGGALLIASVAYFIIAGLRAAFG